MSLIKRIFKDSRDNLFGVGGGAGKNFATATTSRYVFSGDVKLASKPTWAY